jgi:hypothetical protein
MDATQPQWEDMVIRDAPKFDLAPAKPADKSKIPAAVRRPEPKVQAAYLAHELRAPVTSIRLGLEILSEQIEPKLQADEKQMLSLAIRNTMRLEGLVNDIMDYSKIAAGKLAIVKEPCDARTLVDDAADSLRAMATAKGVKISKDYAPLLPRCAAENRRVIQVLMNLISNAIKFTPSRGLVTVSVAEGKYEHAGTLIFKVKDTGCGIPHDELEKIFGLFEQAGGSQQRQSQGTGLGLVLEGLGLDVLLHDPGRDGGHGQPRRGLRGAAPAPRPPARRRPPPQRLHGDVRLEDCYNAGVKSLVFLVALLFSPVVLRAQEGEEAKPIGVKTGLRGTVGTGGYLGRGAYLQYGDAWRLKASYSDYRYDGSTGTTRTAGLRASYQGENLAAGINFSVTPRNDFYANRSFGADGGWTFVFNEDSEEVSGLEELELGAFWSQTRHSQIVPGTVLLPEQRNLIINQHDLGRDPVVGRVPLGLRPGFRPASGRRPLPAAAGRSRLPRQRLPRAQRVRPPRVRALARLHTLYLRRRDTLQHPAAARRAHLRSRRRAPVRRPRRGPRLRARPTEGRGRHQVLQLRRQLPILIAAKTLLP